MSLIRCTCVQVLATTEAGTAAVRRLAADPWCPATAVHKRTAQANGTDDVGWRVALP